MHHFHSIDFNERQKNPSGVYEISLPELHDLRFTEIPFYSTVQVTDLPEAADPYRLEVRATHGGGPHDEFFGLNFHVQFIVPGNSENETAVKTCKRRNSHIKRFFADTARSLGLEHGPDWVPYFVGEAHLIGGVLFSRLFARVDDPVLTEIIAPFVERFNAFLNSKDLLLFICHASEDKPFVEQLCVVLDGQKVPVWYDRREIKVGESIVQRVEQGLGAASHVVVVLSEISVRKPWVRKELSSTLMRQLANVSVQVLPIVVDECQLPPLLADIKFADCRIDRERGYNELLDAIL